MVAIKSSEAERFLNRDMASFSAFLVFGADVGLVSERVRHIVKAVVDDPNDPFQLVRLSGDDLARDTPRLLDEAQTVPLFGRQARGSGRCRHQEYRAGRRTLPGGRLALSGGHRGRCAETRRALRKAVERSKRAAAIECYPDGEREIAALIESEIAAAGQTIDPDAKAMLASLLGADRLASRSEIGKLLLYAHDAHARKVTGSTMWKLPWPMPRLRPRTMPSTPPFREMSRALDDAIKRLHLNPVDAGLLLGAALRHANMLHRAKLAGGRGARGVQRGRLAASQDHHRSSDGGAQYRHAGPHHHPARGGGRAGSPGPAPGRGSCHAGPLGGGIGGAAQARALTCPARTRDCRAI